MWILTYKRAWDPFLTSNFHVQELSPISVEFEDYEKGRGKDLVIRDFGPLESLIRKLERCTGQSSSNLPSPRNQEPSREQR